MALKAVRRSRLPLSLERHRDDFDPLQELLPDDTGPERRLSNQEFRKRVWVALGKLTPKQRAVIVFRYYLEMGEAEIAEELDIPTGTVKSRLYAARQRLRRLLSPVW
jgi:RNA polymerase sigma-70 factor, ECF subfamily